MRKWHMIIDIAKCEDCNNCFLACKDEYVDNDWPGYNLAQPLHGQRWMNIMRKERGTYPMVDVAYRPTPCMHCANPPCKAAASNDAVYQREDGIVIIDPVKAKGQKDLVKSCPYGAIFWNETAQVPQKCTFCAHLLDQKWQSPRCIQSCPTGALSVAFVEEQDMAARVEAESLQTLIPEQGTQPRVYYKNLYRYDTCFVGGSVSFQQDGVVDCAKGATVALTRDSNRLKVRTTDDFGDFKFDGLSPDSGPHELIITFQDHEKRVDVVVEKKSINIGEVIFD